VRPALAGLLALLPACAALGLEPSGTADVHMPATRIVTLAPHLTELAFAAGAGDRLVGVSAYSDYPPAARALPVVSSSLGTSAERVLALKPDLVLAWDSGNRPADIRTLRELGLPVVVSEPRSLGDIAELLNLIGRLAGTRQVASAAATAYLARVADLRARYAHRAAVPVFFQISERPLMTLAGGHVINDLLELCGARNVFSGLDTLAPTVSVEAVIGRAPRAVLVGTSMPEVATTRARWQRRLPGVVVKPVAADLLLRHTTRVVEGAAQLCEQVEAVRRGRD